MAAPHLQSTLFHSTALGIFTDLPVSEQQQNVFTTILNKGFNTIILKWQCHFPMKSSLILRSIPLQNTHKELKNLT
jgi:hypothetical protein